MNHNPPVAPNVLNSILKPMGKQKWQCLNISGYFTTAGASMKLMAIRHRKFIIRFTALD